MHRHGHNRGVSNLTLSVPPDPARLQRVRERIRHYLSHHCDDLEAVDDMVLVIEEAATNAIRHSGVDDDLDIALRFEGESMVASVRDRGPGFDADAQLLVQTPDPLAPGGRGLFLMASLADELHICRDAGLEVRLTKRMPVRAGRPPPRPAPGRLPRA